MKWNHRRRSVVLLIFLFLNIADLALTSFHYINVNRFAREYQGVPLKDALAMKEGTYVYDGCTHPLYMMVLSTWASRSSSFFTRSKLFSFFLMAMTLLFYFVATRRWLGGVGAAAAMAATMASWPVFSLSFQLRCEVLLFPLFVFSWYATIRAFGDVRWAIPAGFLAGFAYLTKGTGLLLPIAVVVSALLLYKREWRCYRLLGLYLIAFGVVAWPLWIANNALYGYPLYHESMAHAVWLDRYTPEEIAQIPTWFSYFKNHSVLSIARRLIENCGFYPVVVYRTFLPHTFFFPHKLLFIPWVALVVIGTAIQKVRRRLPSRSASIEDRAFGVFTWVLFGVFYVPFAWFQQTTSTERFILVLVPLLFAWLVRWSIGLARAWGPSPLGVLIFAGSRPGSSLFLSACRRWP